MAIHRSLGFSGDEAHLEQHGRHVGRQQHDEAGVAVAAAQQGRLLAHRLQQGFGEGGRAVLGGALGQVEQDLADRAIAARQIGLHQPVVLLEHPRHALGALFRQGVDAGAAGRGVGSRIGVQRDEQVGVGPAGDLHAGFQRHEGVGLAGHDHGVAAGLLQLGLQRLGGGQGDVLLGGVGARRAGILAAVAGVDDDDLLQAQGRALAPAPKPGSASGPGSGPRPGASVDFRSMT
jgi:hypothetical protein